MTENKAHALLIAGGMVTELAIYFGFTAIGSSDEVLVMLMLLCFIAMSLLVGAIGVYYERRHDQHHR